MDFMIKAIVFDFFGVIYPDTLSLVTRKFIGFDKQKLAEIRDVRLQCDRGLIDRDEFWNSVAQIMNVTHEQLDMALQRVQQADWKMLELIKELRSKYKTAMLSNVGKGFVERIFSDEKPRAEYFDKLFLSGETGLLKPNTEAYKDVTKKLDAEPKEIVFIDDIKDNVRAAEALGMHAILFEDFEQFKKDLSKILADADS